MKTLNFVIFVFRCYEATALRLVDNSNLRDSNSNIATDKVNNLTDSISNIRIDKVMQGRAWRSIGSSCGPGPDALNENPVIASMTTVPGRITAIEENVRRIVNMKEIDRIYVAVPTIYANGAKVTIPVWAEILLRDSNSKFCLMRTDDWGPATKLLAALKSQDVPDSAAIITLDDDRRYEPSHLQNLIKNSKVHPGWVITNLAWPIRKALSDDVSSMAFADSSCISSSDGTFVREQTAHEVDQSGDCTADIVLGCGGVLYPNRKIFDDHIFDMSTKAGKTCFKTDDMWISGHLERLKIKRWNIHGSDPKRNHQEGVGIRGGPYRTCMKEMRKEFGIFSKSSH